jgi:SAM-dependent methyltransferase
MNPADCKAYQKRYTERLARFGHDPRTLGWDKGKQRERFEALTRLVPVERLGSVLDVGCGFGDLLPYLKEKGFAGAYTGVDFVPELIEVGRQAYPDARLEVADFSAFRPHESFDLVLASGIFNARLSDEDQRAYIENTLKKMWTHARVAASADFLSGYVDFRREDLNYTSPEAVFAFAKNLTRRVALLHDYMPFEFALYLFKDDRIAERTLFDPLEAVLDGPDPVSSPEKGGAGEK